MKFHERERMKIDNPRNEPGAGEIIEMRGFFRENLGNLEGQDSREGQGWSGKQ